jgi:uncharacterized membrane-anchored protein YhcB (DUF1043 family)
VLETPIQNQGVGPFPGEIGNYVAHLQLHMALQARKLLPNTLDSTNPCHALLYQSQAEYEKLISRRRC